MTRRGGGKKDSKFVTEGKGEKYTAEDKIEKGRGEEQGRLLEKIGKRRKQRGDGIHSPNKFFEGLHSYIPITNLAKSEDT